MSCERIRQIGHAVLDGDLMDATCRADFDRHVASCTECREWFGDLTRLQRDLRNLPQPEFPAAALEELWSATTRGPAVRRGLDWRPLAAAAALTLALLGLLREGSPKGAVAAQHTPQEIAEAAEQAQFAFRLAAEAINKAERTAVREIVDEVSPALRVMPMRWSATEDDDESKRQGV